MNYTIMCVFVDKESDAQYTSFDRGMGDRGYPLVEAISRIMHRATDAHHSGSVTTLEGMMNGVEGATFRVKVEDDSTMQRWSLCAE